MSMNWDRLLYSIQDGETAASATTSDTPRFLLGKLCLASKLLETIKYMRLHLGL